MTARSFRQVLKDLTIGDVHAPTALGNEEPDRALSVVAPKPRVVDFKTALAARQSVGKVYASTADLPAAVKNKIKDETKRRQWLHVFNGELKAHGDEGRAFASAWSAVKKSVSNPINGEGAELVDPKRPRAGDIISVESDYADLPLGKQLRDHDGAPGLARSPFPHDPNALAALRDDQVPRFFGALTDQDRLPVVEAPLSDLTAMQDRVDPAKVEAMRSAPPAKPPLVVGFNGRKYIADGHHRLAAAHENGATSAPVRYLDLAPRSNAVKREHTFEISAITPAEVVKQIGRMRGQLSHYFDLSKNEEHAWRLPITVTKADPTQRLVFGWASVVTKNGRLIVDHQGDAIEPAELEKAVYEYVLNSRDHGDLHVRKGCGRLIESVVLTKEKQAAMGIALPDAAEAWWIGMRVDDDELWAAHKRGERPEWSIGGSGVRVPYQED